MDQVTYLDEAEDGFSPADSASKGKAKEQMPAQPGATPAQAQHGDLDVDSGAQHRTQCRFTQLPAELIANILCNLSPVDLAHVSATCRILYTHAIDDRLWRAHVQANVPGQIITSSYPCSTFRELYRAHDPHWFLPRYKIWFGDSTYLGSLNLIRYDQRRGCIEGYLLLANNTTTDPPFAVDNLWVSPFKPDIHLHLDQPSLRLPIHRHSNAEEDGKTIRILTRRDQVRDGSSQSKWEVRDLSESRSSYADPIMMQLGNWSYIKTTFRLARCLSEEEIETYGTSSHSLWPPTPIPSSHRLLATGMSIHTDLGPKHCPLKRSEICEHAFRIARGPFHFQPASWLGGSPAAVPYGPRTQFCEEVTTYSTLDPVLYTPTRRYPLRGIWVGDYGVHGCEFLLMHQPDVGEEEGEEDEDDNDSDSDAGSDDTITATEPEFLDEDPEHDWATTSSLSTSSAIGEGEDETNPSSSSNHANTNATWWKKQPRQKTTAAARKNKTKNENKAPIYRGRLEAIKLTGDSNVPRGEPSFVVDDLGDGGFVGLGEEAPFTGARRVRSKGHIARAGFTSDEYIDGELVIISPDLLAHKWFQLRHVSYFRRVDIDRFLVPE